MGGWEAASAGEVGGVGVSSVAVGVPVYCCNGVFNILPNSSGMYTAQTLGGHSPDLSYAFLVCSVTVASLSLICMYPVLVLSEPLVPPLPTSTGHAHMQSSRSYSESGNTLPVGGCSGKSVHTYVCICAYIATYVRMYVVIP